MICLFSGFSTAYDCCTLSVRECIFNHNSVINLDSRISVVIPAYNAAAHLAVCLKALCGQACAVREIIVVDDGSTDDTRTVAESFRVRVLASARRGPAFARNTGARLATGDILLFLDADVSVHQDTLGKIKESFDADPQLDALMGSYDSNPQSPDFLSQYRNLMHAYFHHTGCEKAFTFWSGCGAIRRDLFLAHSGFDEGFGRPAIEDIELGYRLIHAGRKILLDRSLQVTHLKRWTFWNLVKTDMLDRGIPWTELIMRDGSIPNDLNLQISQRISVAMVFLLVMLSGLAAVLWKGYFLVPLFVITFVLLARWWVEFASPGRPRWAPLVLVLVVGSIIALSYSHHMYGLIPPLAISPVLLLLKHRYAHGGPGGRLPRWFALTYIGVSMVLAAHYLPFHSTVLACSVLLAVLGVLNSQFFLFLAETRGTPFMLAAVPFHLFYHFYNGISFATGVVRHVLGITGRAPQYHEDPAP
jgi:glycosyltransferase involved in cell wall biosynthesis